jgi:hypothetical protein
MSPADVAAQLEEAVSATFRTFQGRIEVADMASQPWASATFSGARHTFELRLRGESAGEAVSAFLAELEHVEVALRGHFLADLAATGEPRALGEDGVCLALEALTVRAC